MINRYHLVPLLALAISVQIASSKDWPNWHGPNRDGVSTETGWNPKKLDNIKWRAQVGIGFASVSVSDGKLFTLGHNGSRGSRGEETVYCLDARTGKEIWSDRYKAQLLPNLHEGGPSSTPTVHNGFVYTLSKDGRLICYRSSNGERHWETNILKASSMSKPAEWGFASSPLIVGEMLIIEAAQTIALNKNTGKVIWKSKQYQPAYGTPSVLELDGKTYLATVKNDGLVILNAKDGQTVAFAPWKTRFQTNANTPIVRDNLIFISTGYQRGCALFKFTGEDLEQVYTNKKMSNHMSNSVLFGNHLYGFDGNTHGGGKQQFKCLVFTTGKELWAQGGFGIGGVTVAGNQLLILTERGELVIAKASPEQFSLIHRAQVIGGKNWNVPVLANGFIYARNAAGRLVAIDVQ